MRIKKYFAPKLLLLLLIVISSLYFPINHYSSQGVDEYYLRFTQSDNPNLILGSSRAAQAFNPDLTFDNSGLNFSFTHSVSPYGKIYNKAIEKILAKDNGTIILEVCPMQFSEYRKKAKDESRFRENDLMVGNMIFYGCTPNIEYILKNYKKPLYRLFLHDPSGQRSELHTNGWLEVVDGDEKNFTKKLKKNKKYFNTTFKQMVRSEIRLQRFTELIQLLKSKGKNILIVRTPISNDLLQLENEYWKDFSTEIKNIAKDQNVGFVDFSADSSFQTHDGNHLNSVSAQRFSKLIHQLTKKQ